MRRDVGASGGSPPRSDARPLQTERLRLRRFTLDDAAFALRLVNEPSFHRYIGDRGVRSLEDAGRYLSEGPIRSYEREGFGLYLVERRRDDEPIGMCGLVRRVGLDGPDLGYAFCEEHWGRGYATEAAAAVVEEARLLGLGTLLAITSEDNEASRRVLESLGMEHRGPVQLAVGDRAELFELDLRR